MAEIAASKGLNVVMLARSAAELEAVAARINASGGTAIAVPGDITHPEDCQRVIDIALEHFGRIDAVVNNAAVLQPMDRLEDIDLDAWEYALRVNVTGPLALIKAAIPHLRIVKGRVINVSSGAAVRARNGWGAYSITKAALNMLTAMLAEEEPDIVAVALRPGVIDTAMQQMIRDQGASSMAADQHALFVRLHDSGDLLPPERPARAIVALALYAPRSLDGEFVSWDDDVVQGLLRKHNGG